MKIILMGTSAFAVPALVVLLDKDYDVVAVCTMPPKKKGRGRKLLKTPVHVVAERNEIPVLTPTSLKDKDVQQQFAQFAPDAVVVAAYGQILPKQILDIPKYGCFNIHASLLPRWHGAAPIQRAIMAGDTKTGVTIMKMDEGLDSGDILLSKKVTIKDGVTAGTLHDDLSIIGADLMVEFLAGLPESLQFAVKQDTKLITYAKKITKEEEKINWNDKAVEIERHIRAFNPYPGCYFVYNNEIIKVFAAKIVKLKDKKSAKPGQVLDENLLIACGQDALLLEKVQRQNKKIMLAQEMLKGFSIKPGEVLF